MAYQKKQWKRHADVNAKRSKVDLAFRLHHTLRVVAAGLVSGKRTNSPTFLRYTSFVNEVEFQTHMNESARTSGFNTNKYGTEWVIEHIIPQEAFDFSNPDDVKRCWSKPNLRALCPKKNDEKGVNIIDELCRQVGAAYFPLSWNGTIPTEAEKCAFYVKCNTPLA